MHYCGHRRMAQRSREQRSPEFGFVRWKKGRPSTILLRGELHEAYADYRELLLLQPGQNGYPAIPFDFDTRTWGNGPEF